MLLTIGFLLPSQFGSYDFLRIRPGDYRFAEGTTVLVIPGSVVEICDGAFASCAMERYVLAEGCRKAGASAFVASFEELWLPGSIRICRAFAEAAEDGSFVPLALDHDVILHYAGDEAVFAKIDFGCPLPETVKILYDDPYPYPD